MPLILRSAGLNDIPAILALERGASGAVHWNSEQYERLVSSGMVLAAEENGELCGFICAGAAAGEWEIENVVVGSGFLRRGIGDALMRELIRRARDEGAAAILLEVRESNAAARALYRKHGFVETGRRRLYYNFPEEDAVLYELRLGS